MDEQRAGGRTGGKRLDGDGLELRHAA